jgi:hypothetical protein
MVRPTPRWMNVAMVISARVMRSPTKNVRVDRWLLRVVRARI